MQPRSLNTHLSQAIHLAEKRRLQLTVSSILTREQINADIALEFSSSMEQYTDTAGLLTLIDIQEFDFVSPELPQRFYQFYMPEEKLENTGFTSQQTQIIPFDPHVCLIDHVPIRHGISFKNDPQNWYEISAIWGWLSVKKVNEHPITRQPLVIDKVLSFHFSGCSPDYDAMKKFRDIQNCLQGGTWPDANEFYSERGFVQEDLDVEDDYDDPVDGGDLIWALMLSGMGGTAVVAIFYAIYLLYTEPSIPRNLLFAFIYSALVMIVSTGFTLSSDTSALMALTDFVDQAMAVIDSMTSIEDPEDSLRTGLRL